MKHLFVACVVAASAVPVAAVAADYPTRPLSVVIPAAPGGPSDVLARLLSEQLQSRLGQSVVVENRGGANGTIGVGVVARAAPDGYTTLLAVDGPITTIPALMPQVPYDATTDLQPVAVIGDGGDVVLAVPANSPAQNPRELAELMRADPAGANYVSSGAGFASHIVAELFKREADFTAQHIPVRGAGAAMTELLSGRMSFGLPPASLAAAQAQAGTVRILAVAASERNALLPDVPTFAEAGYPGVQPPSYWIGTYVPAGTPGPVVDKLAEATRQAVTSDAFAKALAMQGMVASSMPPEAIAERVSEERDYWARLVKELDITLD